jgi:hypothetical protein
MFSMTPRTSCHIRRHASDAIVSHPRSCDGTEKDRDLHALSMAFSICLNRSACISTMDIISFNIRKTEGNSQIRNTTMVDTFIRNYSRDLATGDGDMSSCTGPFAE